MRMMTIFAGLLISVSGLSFTQAPVDADELCEQTAELVADNAGIADEGFGFACLPDGSLNIEDADGHSYAGSWAVGASSSSSNAPASDEESFCRLDQAPTRTIVGERQENLRFCIYYGEKNSPVNGSWTETMDIRADVNLQYNSHHVALRSMGGGSTTAELSGVVAYYNHPNVATKNLIAASAFSLSDTWSPGIALNAYVGDGWGDAYSYATQISRYISIENLYVTQPAYAFSIGIEASIPSHAFACDKFDEKCFWPNGEEANLGMAG